MATYFPAKINTAWIGYIGLVSQADTKLLLASPTIAAGDFKVSIDGGALNNLTTLPTVTPAAGYRVKISLSAAEMNGENISVSCIDAAGAEWCSLLFNIPTSARQIDDLATPTNITAGTITTATNVTTVNGLAANVITAASIATDAIDSDAIAASAVTEIQSGLATAAALTVVDDFLDTEIADIQARLPAALIGGRIDANMGAISSDAIAADNAEAFFDGTGYAGTGNIIPTVTTATNVTTVNGLAAGVITAASIAADAITDAKVAADVTIASVTGAVGSVTGAVGSVTGNVGGNVSGTVGSVVGAVGSVTGNVGGNVTGSVGSVVGLTAANLDATVSSRATPAQILTTALTEAYASDGVAPTLSQFLFQLLSVVSEFSISGTTITAKKLDGATTSMTFTLDDAVNPTSRTRAT